MKTKWIPATCMALAIGASGLAVAEKPHGAVQCSDLKWSAEVRTAYPDIDRACQGVYEKDGILYAKATIEVIRVLGNTLRFQTLLTDGGKGARRSVTLGSQWSVNIAGREYRLAELTEGQQLDIFLPEDQFALTVLGSNQAGAAAIETGTD